MRGISCSPTHQHRTTHKRGRTKTHLLLGQSLGIAQKRLLQVMPPPADLDEIDADLDEIDEVASRILREQFRVEGRNGRCRLRHKISCERYPEVFSECNRAKMPVDLKCMKIRPLLHFVGLTRVIQTAVYTSVECKISSITSTFRSWRSTGILVGGRDSNPSSTANTRTTRTNPMQSD